VVIGDLELSVQLSGYWWFGIECSVFLWKSFKL